MLSSSTVGTVSGRGMEKWAGSTERRRDKIDDCKLVYMILAINVILVGLFFKEYKITTFDPALSKAFGISLRFYQACS